MEDKKGINWIFALIAFTLGLVLKKHIDFKSLTLKEPYLDILYIIVFLMSIYMTFKDMNKQSEK